MRRSLLATTALAAAIATAGTSASCTKHPAITVGATAGAIALFTCEANSVAQGTCGIITASVALGLGGLAALVTYFADTNAHEIKPDEELLPNGRVRIHTHTEPPPSVAPPIDAGAALESATVDASVDAGVADSAP
jgi:hypothetical protein